MVFFLLPTVLRTLGSAKVAKVQFPYRNETNQRYTKQLFHEQWSQLPTESRVIEPAFTLFNTKPGLTNLGREYLNDCDPTGYTTSTRIFGEYGYWKYLLKASWFREAVRIWDEELDAKLYAQGLAKIRDLANSDDKGALTAAKYLANKEFKLDRKGPVRGRPSNEEVEGRLVQEAQEKSELEDDAARIRLVK